MKIQHLFVAGLVLTMSCNQGSSSSSSTDSTKTTTDSTKMVDSSKTAQTNTPADDAKFLNEAADGGALEVALGHLAETKGQDTAVKHFGRDMVHDHSRMGDQLKQLAAIKQVQIPATLSDKSKDEVQKLQAKQGKDFDKAYIDAMVKDHQDDIDAFNKEASQSGDSTITAFVRDHLPMLQMHLQHAQTVQSELK